MYFPDYYSADRRERMARRRYGRDAAYINMGSTYEVVQHCQDVRDLGRDLDGRVDADQTTGPVLRALIDAADRLKRSAANALRDEARG